MSLIDVTARHTLSLGPNSSVVDDISKIGLSSARLTGNGSKVIVSDNPSDFIFGANPFTYEAWIRFNTIPTTYAMIFDTAHDTGSGFQFYWYPNNTFSVYNLGTISGTFTPATEVWYHIVFTGNGSTVKVYVNGTLIGSLGYSSLSTAANALYLGADGIAGRSPDIWIDEVRVSNIQRYTSNFTPPTSKFTSDANTLLLVHFDESAGNLITWTDTVGVTVNRNSLTDTGGAFGNSAAASQEVFDGDVSVSFTCGPNSYPVQEVMIGLSHTNPDHTYTSIEWGLYPGSNGLIYVIQNGAIIGATGTGAYVEGDIYTIERVGSVANFYKNGNAFFINGAFHTNSLLVDVAMNSIGSVINNAVYIAANIIPPSTFWKNEVGVTVNGNSLTKTASDAWGNAGASTVATFAGDVLASFTVNRRIASPTYSDIMFGLSATDPNTNYTSINFAIYTHNNGFLYIYHNGAMISEINVPYVNGDILSVGRYGTTIYYMKNGVVFYVGSVSSTGSLLIDTALYYVGTTIDNVVFTESPNVPDFSTIFANSTTLHDAVFQGGQNVTIVGNRVTKTGGSAATWDAGASSTYKIVGDGGVNFTCEADINAMVGLSYRDINVNYSSIDFAIYLAAPLGVLVYEKGISKGTFGNYSIGDIFSVYRYGNTIYYLKNGTIFYISTQTSVGSNYNPISQSTLLVDVSIYQPNETIKDVQIWSSDNIFYPVLNPAQESADSGFPVDLGQWQYGYSYVSVGNWCKYDFISSKTITSIYLIPEVDPNGSGIKDFNIQGSNDNSNWTTLTSGQVVNTTNPAFTFQPIYFVNIISYRYYKINTLTSWRPNSSSDKIGVNFAFGESFAPLSTIEEVVRISDSWEVDYNLVNLIPIMTSLTTPSGIASSSPLDYSYPSPAWWAMDNDTNSVWLSQWGYGGDEWIQYQFPTSQNVIAYGITYTFMYDDRQPTAWVLEGSNNGADWTALDTRTGISWTPAVYYEFQKKIFLITTPTSFDYYRLRITSHHNSWTNISEFALYGTGLPPTETLDINESVTIADAWLTQVTKELAHVDASLSMVDSWNIQTNPDSQSFYDTINVADTWKLQTNPEFQNNDDTLNLVDAWSANTDSGIRELLNSVSISDSWILNQVGTFAKKITTKLYTILTTPLQIVTQLRVALTLVSKYQTNLYTQFLASTEYNTDLRVKYIAYDDITVGTLDNFLVKLDGISLLDVDYNTLIINLTLNTTPSTATFTLARRHDDLDRMLNGTTSIITAENKVEVYDGTRKLFTGYVSQINADSNNDTVHVTASDCRLKMSRVSKELAYGGAWRADGNHNHIADDDELDNSDVAYDAPEYIKFQKNISQAFTEVMASVGSLVSGYDALPFTGSFVPEYVKFEKDCASLIDELVRQTANCNWYIDENERLRFQKIGTGIIKQLPLASLNSKRHAYELIVDDVQLNRPMAGYAQSLNVKRGKYVVQTWHSRTFKGWISDDFNNLLNTLADKTYYAWHVNQEYPEYMRTLYPGKSAGANGWYTGMNGVIMIGMANSGSGGIPFFISYPTVVVQWADRESSLNLPDITVGSGNPKRTIYLTSYGKRNSGSHYVEQEKVTGNPNSNGPVTTKVYITRVTEEIYDQTSFLLDLARFELAQNNKLQSSANLSLLLDAYEYYNISFSNLVNLTNTIQSGIYQNNNGFPLNIDNIQINCSTRTVNLSLTNYGKSWYAKTANYLLNYKPPVTNYLQEKVIFYYWSAGGTLFHT